MSTTPASDEVLQHAQGFIACIRDVVREELASAAPTGAAAFDAEALKTELRDEVRRDVLAAGGTSGGADPVQACIENADALFGSSEWKRLINQLIQEALKGVLPSMVKRFRSEMEEAVGELPAAGGSGGGDPTAVINSTEMKEMLEDRFRQMLLYLKTDVIPKAVEQSS